MKAYDTAAKRKRTSLINNYIAREIKHIGIEILIRKGMILDKKIDMLIRKIDVKEHKKVIKQILPEQ